MISRWINKLKSGKLDLKDAPQVGHLTLLTDKNLEAVEQPLNKDIQFVIFLRPWYKLRPGAYHYYQKSEAHEDLR